MYITSCKEYSSNLADDRKIVKLIVVNLIVISFLKPIYIYIYIYIYIIYIHTYIIYIHVVFSTDGFVEPAIESWPQWDSNPRLLNSIQTL